MIRMTTLCPNLATVFSLWALLATAAFAQEPMSVLQDYFIEESPAIPLVGAGQAIPVVTAEQHVDELDVLTRGPLHEAFASAHQADPQSSMPIFQAPPELVDELPPEYKPEGINVQWISGYWAWDDSQSDFIWISGIWRDVPPNRRWMPGYWDAEGNAHRWVSGFWIEETQQELGYLPEPPTSIDQGPSTISPSQQHFYVPGNWQFQNDRYRWLSGHWQPVVENRIWIPAQYVWTPNGCVYQSGYWDYELEDRGTCFAPVHFNRPVYLSNSYRYRPSHAINLNTDFMTHLFVRQRCGHYFYGDWYASNFNNLGYRPWVSYNSHFRNYDPLLTYYRSRRSSFDSRYNVVQHLARQHSFYINNRDYRPRPTYKSQYQHARNIQERYGSHGRNNDYIRRSSYVSAYKDLRSHGGNRNSHSPNVRYQSSRSKHDIKQHHKVAKEELRNSHRTQELLANLQRDRKRREHSGKNRFTTATHGSSRIQIIPSTRQREQEILRNALDQSRQAAAHAQRRSHKIERHNQTEKHHSRSKQMTQTDQSRRAQLEKAKRHQQDRDRRTQQEQVRRSQQELARKNAVRKSQQASALKAKLDQARRGQQNAARNAQQDLARRAQQDRARQQAAQHSRQQQAQRDSARKAKQIAQQNAARVAQKNKNSSKQKAPQESRSSRLRNRSKRK